MIALVEWNQNGHHDTYLVIHASTLLHQGHRLLVLCRDPQRFREAIINRIHHSYISLLDVAPIPGPEWIRKWRRLPFGFAYTAFSICILRQLRRGEKRHGNHLAEVFFCCIYEHQTRMLHAVIRSIGGRQWSGLYLHAHAFHNPHVLAPGVKSKWPISKLWFLPGLRGLLMLDESIAPHVSACIRQPVLILPDIAATELRREDALVAELKMFACGRTIIGLLGHIVPSKGVTTFLRCAQRDEMRQVVFAIAGTVQWDMFNDEDRKFLHDAFQLPNVWLRDLRIPDEASYNALFDACAVIYAAYENYPHSSNTLTKAAAFQKPVLVHNRSLMAERVRRYGLGECFSEGDPIAQRCKALLRLAWMNSSPEAIVKPDWQGYLATHSEQRLAEVFADFFPSTQEHKLPDNRNDEK